jgi:hypothetical protein
MRYIVLCLALISLVGCKKKTTPTSVQQSTATEVSGPQNTNYEAGAGVAQNVRNAAKRIVTQTEMGQLGVFIEDSYSTLGKMPGVNAIMASLQKESPNTHKMIQEGAIILCWTAQHEGLWAYEVDADKKGGIVLVTGAARRADADEVKRLLGK